MKDRVLAITLGHRLIGASGCETYSLAEKGHIGIIRGHSGKEKGREKGRATSRKHRGISARIYMRTNFGTICNMSIPRQDPPFVAHPSDPFRPRTWHVSRIDSRKSGHGDVDIWFSFPRQDPVSFLEIRARSHSIAYDHRNRVLDRWRLKRFLAWVDGIFQFANDKRISYHRVAYRSLVFPFLSNAGTMPRRLLPRRDAEFRR